MYSINRAISAWYRWTRSWSLAQRSDWMGSLRCPKEIKDQRVSNITAALTARYMYNSPRYLTQARRLWLNLKMFSYSSALLKYLNMTHLQSDPDILHGLIQHANSEIRMISLQIEYEPSNKSDIPIFQFPDVRKCLEQVAVHLMFSYGLETEAIELTSGSSQCSFLRYLRTLSIVRLTSTLCIKCWIQLSIGDSSTISLVTLSGGLHYCQPKSK